MLHLPTCEFSLAGPYVSNIGFHLLFDWRSVALGSFQGWMMAFILVVVAGLDAIFLRFVVRRSGQAWLSIS